MKVFAANNEEINLKDTDDDVMPTPRKIESEEDLIDYAANEGAVSEDEGDNDYDDDNIDDIEISDDEFENVDEVLDDTDDLFDDDDDIDKILKEETEE